MVRSYRFAINKQEDLIDPANKIITTRKQNLIHQLIKVLRVGEAESHPIELIDGYSNNIYQVKLINEIDKKILKKLDFEITGIINSEKELETKVHFYLPIIKNENFELMLRKLCELGVSEFTPISFKYSQRKYLRKLKEHAYQERLLKIIESATEQCNGSVFAKLNPAIDFSDFVNQDHKQSSTDLKIYASEKLADSSSTLFLTESTNTLRKLAAEIRELTFLVGPEGGLCNEEINTLERMGFLPLSLGKRILRAETAAIVLMSKFDLG